MTAPAKRDDRPRPGAMLQAGTCAGLSAGTCAVVTLADSSHDAGYYSPNTRGENACLATTQNRCDISGGGGCARIWRGHRKRRHDHAFAAGHPGHLPGRLVRIVGNCGSPALCQRSLGALGELHDQRPRALPGLRRGPLLQNGPVGKRRGLSNPYWDLIVDTNTGVSGYAADVWIETGGNITSQVRACP